ncbi:metallophosphoesterase [Nannocystaceae bacterium ST9]
MRRLNLRNPCFALPLLLACADDGGLDGNVGTDSVATDEVGTSTLGESTTTAADDGDSTSSGDPSGETTSDATGSTTDTGETTSDATDTDSTDTTTGDGDVDIDLTFVTFGDAGEGSAEQYAVADAVEMVCADKNCAFVLYLGDNFYDDGVASAMDDQFQTKFEMPYADLDLPFKIVLGNHDYGLLSFAWEKAAYEIEYSNYSDKWELPSQYYTFSYPGVDLFVFDTTQFMWNHNTSDQQNWIDQEIGSSDATWKIAAAHHPYYSNGEHGNAGNYEGFPFPPQLAGTTVKNVLDDSVCGKVDVFFSGHDHNRQWVKPTCQGTSLIVSGGGAKTTEFAYHGGGNEVWWEDDVKPGFMLVHVTNDVMHTEFYDSDGVMEFSRDIVK